MISFMRQFFSNSHIAQVWDDIFSLIESSPLGVLCGICISAFAIYLIGRVVFR